MKWLENLSRAIEYIENHLDKDISYDEAAQIACCSTYYFQRVFSYVAGISLSEYIRRRRMTQAAFELQRTDKKVVDIALKYGYASPTSFNRAFKNVHGIAPFTAKSMGSKLNAYPAIKFSVTVTGGSAMSYHIEEKEAIGIAGIRTPLIEDMEENQRAIPHFWEDVLQKKEFQTICDLSNQQPHGVLGVSVYENPQNIFYYIASATDHPVPIGMFEYEIPASTWVVFENHGCLKEDVQSVFKRFYTEWLPFSGYEYAGLPDIEVYPIHDQKLINGHSEVWIAIKKEKEN
ncbi:AraC family transcriptional regulator [Irregularibacter muris]|uniref:AraC family transcriptional regulator n=1 Tax=Irregularibacter muris TaxID=1796619 RepID=A0AAE3HF48_9FIRM|nr:AraC family transcriptional regulator [Irregularibacter muris]MCR1897413.1 AraC family transcriptional regulator [Irregularibacter muris]